MIYEKIENEFGKTLKGIDELGNIYWIPINESNSDYQAYLASLEEGEPKAE